MFLHLATRWQFILYLLAFIIPYGNIKIKGNSRKNNHAVNAYYSIEIAFVYLYYNLIVLKLKIAIGAFTNRFENNIHFFLAIIFAVKRYLCIE